MQTLADYDPYAIEEIEFFVEKKTKYTTLKSILVTLGILALTVVLNLGAIQHLWLQTSQLPVVSTSRRMSIQPLTSSYFCMFPKTVNSTLPRTALINFNKNTNQTIKRFSVTDKFKNIPEVVNAAAGRESVCYDVEGTILTEVFRLRMLVYGLNGDEFDFIIKTYSTKEILKDQNQLSNFFFVKAPSINANRAMSYVMQLKKISAIYFDQLLVDYEPEKIISFGTRQDYATWNTAVPGASHIDLFSQNFFPFDLTDQYVITRYNIAEILGRVLSWFSVFVLICAMAVSPILDFNYRLELAQKLYDNQKLNSIDISIWSYVKYLISKLKKNLFKQEVIETAFDQLEKDIDLLNMIKRQALMKKLIKQNQTLNIPNKQVQNSRNVEMSMDCSQVLLSKDLALDVGSQSNDRQGLVREQQQEGQESPLTTEPDQQGKDGFLTRLIKSFDISEVEISLISNKGQGYKTSWSTIVTVVFMCGVVWFVLFAGLFELTPNYSVDTVPLLSDESLYPQITLNPADIIFRANRTVTSNFNLSVVLLDKYENIVETLILLSGSLCNDYVLGMNESITGGWLCLNKSITLANDGMQLQRKIGMRLVYRGFGLGVTNLQAKMVQYNLKQHELEKSFYYFRQLFSSTSNYIYNSQTIIKKNQQEQQQQKSGPEAYWTVNSYDQNFETVFKGITIQLSPEFIRVQKTIPNIWDVINNAWGIVVVAFTVFLTKITRYLNVRQRQRITQNEENQNRNDIVAIISTQYKLLNTVFHNELKPLKYFYKTKFYDLPMKQN